VSAGKRGRWLLQPSVSGYVRHLRDEAAGRNELCRGERGRGLSGQGHAVQLLALSRSLIGYAIFQRTNM
jgi:hypothetical protein